MEDVDVITQQPVWTEGRLLVEERTLHVAAIDLTTAESLELIIAVMLTEEFIRGDVVVAAVTEEPDIGLASLLQDGLERQRHTAAVVIVGPGIVAAGILYHLADGAAAPWHIPDAASDFVEEDCTLNFEL